MKAQRIESDGRGDQITPMTKTCLWCFQVSVFATSSRILDILCILEACLQSVWPNLVSSNMDDYFFFSLSHRRYWCVRVEWKTGAVSLTCQKSCLNIRVILILPVSIRDVHREVF